MSSIANAQGAMGYQLPGARPSCQNCDLAVDLRMPGRAPPFPFTCKKGSFGTVPLAWCKHHEPNATEATQSATSAPRPVAMLVLRKLVAALDQPFRYPGEIEAALIPARALLDGAEVKS